MGKKEPAVQLPGHDLRTPKRFLALVSFSTTWEVCGKCQYFGLTLQLSILSLGMGQEVRFFTSFPLALSAGDLQILLCGIRHQTFHPCL